MNRVMLVVMDGVGAAPKHRGNAVALANPKNLSLMWSTYPHTYLLASAEAVGLPKDVKGNSEVGHLNLGAGSVVSQNLPRINKNIEKGYYKSNNVLWDALKHAIKFKSKVHLMGCFSDGAVHSHIDHFQATLEFFAQNNFDGQLFIHAFTDGRDTPPQNAATYFEKLGKIMVNLGIGMFGTIIGRAYAMDRNLTWERTQPAYEMLVNGTGKKFPSWKEAIEDSYAQGKFDEFIPPSIVSGNYNCQIEENDVVIFLNFRADRATQISECFISPEFSHFKVTRFANLFYAGMVEYRKGFPSHVLFPKEYISLPLGKIIAEAGLRQLRIAESEKFPHVTYFFNGGSTIKFKGEDRIEIPSPRVSTYDQKPEMSAYEVEKELVNKIDSDIYDFILLNLANGDMVGHTGNIQASTKAVAVVDEIVDRVTKRFIARGGTVVITADHGNVEETINLKTGQIDTEHSINPVPFVIVNRDSTGRMLPYGALKDVAPTILELMQLPDSSEMTGKSLLARGY